MDDLGRLAERILEPIAADEDGVEILYGQTERRLAAGYLALLARLSWNEAAAESQREALRAALEQLVEAEQIWHVSKGGSSWHSTASIDLDNPGPPCDCRDRYEQARITLKGLT